MEFLNCFEKRENISIKKESDSSLVRRIMKFNGSKTPDWMKDMLVDQNAVVSSFTLSEAWAELVVRKQNKVESPIRSNFESLVKDRMIVMSPGELTVCNNAGIMIPLCNTLGFWGKKPTSAPQADSTLVSARAEVVVDVINVSIISSNEATREMKVVTEEEGNAVRVPVYPYSQVFVDSKTRVLSTRKEAMTNVLAALGKDPVVCGAELLKRGGFTAKSDGSIQVDAKVLKCPSWANAYTYLTLSRKVRGKDSTEQARSSVGYYYGHMSESLYRTAYLSSDIQRLASTFGTKSIQVSSISGVFTQSVINGLVSIGFSVRCPFMYSLGRSDVMDAPGVWSFVPFKGHYLEYHDSKDVLPMNGSTWNPSAAIELFMQNKPSSELTIRFTFVYCHSNVFQYADHLIPSAHAHAGTIIAVSAKISDPVPESDYRTRMVMANAAKNYYPFTRGMYYREDPFAYKKSFSFVPGKVYKTPEEAPVYDTFKPPPILDLDYAGAAARFVEEVAKRKAAELAVISPKAPPPSVEDMMDFLERIASGANKEAEKIADVTAKDYGAGVPNKLEAANNVLKEEMADLDFGDGN